jgi:hypothetical protein
VYIDSPRGFPLVTSGPYRSYLTILPPLLTLSLSPCSPNIQQLMVCYIILYSYIDECFNIFHSLTFSFPLSPPDNTLTQSCSLTIYVYIYIYIYTFNF